MNETANPEATATAADALPPLSPERLPPQARKHVDPKAPLPLRMMGAKALVPLSPTDTCFMLTVLSQDADATVADTAKKTSAGLPDKILSVALREASMDPRVLDFLAASLTGRDNYLEILALNATTPDATVARLAQSGSPRLCELIGQNQLRLLRDLSIVRALCANPAAPPAAIDGVCDFMVRSGVVIDEVEPMRQARIRIFGADAPPPPDAAEEEKLEQEVVVAMAAAKVAPQDDAEALRRPAAAWAKMSVFNKVRSASFKDSAFRQLAIKDPNKIVALAGIRSPRITDGEIEMAANSRVVHEEVTKFIYNNREWTKNYAVKLALVKNPKVPLAVAIRYLPLLQEHDQKDIANNRNVPHGVRAQAKAMLQKKEKATKGPDADKH